MVIRVYFIVKFLRMMRSLPTIAGHDIPSIITTHDKKDIIPLKPPPSAFEGKISLSAIGGHDMVIFQVDESRELFIWYSSIKLSEFLLRNESQTMTPSPP